MVFRPNSSDLSKKYPRNINNMPVVFFRKIFDFERNAYSRTSSWAKLFFLVGIFVACCIQGYKKTLGE